MPVTIMKATCGVAIILGLVSAAASHPATEAPWLLLMDILRWPTDATASTFGTEARVLNAVCGGMLAGWGVLLYWMAAGPVARGDRQARQAYVLSAGVWFVIDSSASLAAGWPGNAAMNVMFLAGLLGPLAAMPGASGRAPQAQH
jgi:hypothetical protein